MDGEKIGLARAIEILRQETGEMRTAEQLSLLPTPAAAGDAAADDATAKRAGPGRPRGSLNKSTSQWMDYIRSRYPSPMLFLAEARSRPVEQLATELGCDTETAFRLQIQCAVQEMPYWHQRQPLAVQIDSKGSVALIIDRSGEARQAVRPGDDARVIEAEIVDPENATKSNT